MELEFEIKGKVKVNIDESILKKIADKMRNSYLIFYFKPIQSRIFGILYK